MIYKILIHNPFCWYKPTTYLSWEIRNVTGKFYNHAGLLRTKADERMYIVHAIGKGVVEVPYDEWQKKEKRVIQISPLKSIYSQPELNKIIDAQIGKKYDFIGLIRMYLYLKFGFWVKKKNEYKRLFCYELVELAEGKNEAYKAQPQLKKI